MSDGLRKPPDRLATRKSRPRSARAALRRIDLPDEASVRRARMTVEFYQARLERLFEGDAVVWAEVERYAAAVAEYAWVDGRRDLGDYVRSVEQRVDVGFTGPRLTLTGLNVLEALETQQRRLEASSEVLDGIVREARAAGVPWPTIGAVVGLDGEAARYRWGRTGSR